VAGEEAGIDTLLSGRDPRLDTFFRDALTAFEAVRALRRDGGDVPIRVGGHAVRLRFADARLRRRLVPPLEHLETRDVAARDSLTVHLWEGDTREAPMPSPPWSAAAYGHRGEVPGWDAGPIRAAYQQTRAGTGVLSMLDREGARALYWLREADDLPEHELGSPLKALFQWWLSAPGCQLMHAAAVGVPGRAVLVAGRGGSGKSTVALGCLASGMSYLGDDYCLVSDRDEPCVYGLYSTGKLAPDALGRFPALRGFLGDRGVPCAGKVLYHLHPIAPGRIGRSARIAAIALPRIRAGGRPGMERAAPAEALLALAPSSLFQLTGAGSDAFHMASRLVRRVPCFWLNLADDLGAVPGLIAEAAGAVSEPFACG
jgi:hypothetical protein